MLRFRVLFAIILQLFGTAQAIPINGELKKALLEELTSDPTGTKGRIYYDSDDLLFRLYNGTSWLSIADLTTAQTFTNKTLTSPKINENVALTTTATKHNYLTSATGTTGTTSTNVVFSTSPTLVTPILGTPQSVNLSNATALPVGSITGLGTGVATWLATPSSANLASAVSDETGSGLAVFATSPTLTTPVLGVASATSVNGTSIPSSKTLVVTTDKLSVLAATSSSELAGVISDETGSGLAVFATSPTLTTPVLGVASATSINSTIIPSSKTLVVTTDKLSVHAATSSSELAGVLSDETGSGVAVFGTAPQFTTNADFKTDAEVRFYDSDDSNYVGFKAPALAANKIWILPTADGSANQLLSTNGSGTLAWASGLSSSLNQYNLNVGDSTNTAASANTNLLGNIKATVGSATVTITIAAPGVVSHTSHGLARGDKIYFTTTGALPTGLTASTTYYVIPVDANSYQIADSLTHSSTSTQITTSGSQSGVHTVFFGGLALTSGVKGTLTNDTATAGYVGEYISNGVGGTSHTSGQYADRGTILLTPGTWDISGCGGIIPGATTVVTRLDVGYGTVTGNDGTGLTNTETATIQFFHAGNVPVDEYAICAPTARVNVASSTTYYLKVYVVWSTSTMSTKGHIQATRIR